MPKLIDYPRTSYAGAWEVADIVDDTGGKCAIDTCARKLNRKVSGSFKAIIGSAVKFGLLTSKRELLTTTTLFRRIKHAYDKQEELLFHREAFLTPPLFTQLCRKFRSRELPVQMLDIMLIREFDVEEINAQGVAKAFIDGARMVGLLDERNVVADIDQLAAQQPPRRELASPELTPNSFRATTATPASPATSSSQTEPAPPPPVPDSSAPGRSVPLRGADAVASLFGLNDAPAAAPPAGPMASPATAAAATSVPTGDTHLPDSRLSTPQPARPVAAAMPNPPAQPAVTPLPPKPTTAPSPPAGPAPSTGFRIQLSGPGLDTLLDIQDQDDLALVRALLDKIGRQLSR